MDKSLIGGKVFNPKTKLMESFFIPVSKCMELQLRIHTDISSPELGQLRLI